MKLLLKTLIRYLLSVAFVGGMLFLPAGTLNFRNGWIFLAALFIPMMFVVVWLYMKDPALLEKRMKTSEREKPQKLYVVLSIVVFTATFILPGFDYRYHWSEVPEWLVIISALGMFCGYLMFFAVMRQNSYASRVIEIQEEQRLIDTGLYGVVRHPMYSAATVMFVFAPLVLGSWFAMIPAAFIPVLLVIRILNEEKVLLEGLKGYGDYKNKVKFRLIPYIW
jgi:protein-S-isoprenylcysteine O-methyltransferase Ste14